MDDGQSDPLYDLSEQLVGALREADLRFATAESCTGGMIAASITDVAGSSNVFDRGFVTYSNDAKTQMIGVDPLLIEVNGAVSSQVAGAMADGALLRADADMAIAVTGIAGPSGGSDDKPVGLVWFACACSWAPTLVTSQTFDNNGRAYIRYQSVIYALHLALETLEERPPLTDEMPVGNA